MPLTSLGVVQSFAEKADVEPKSVMGGISYLSGEGQQRYFVGSSNGYLITYNPNPYVTELQFVTVATSWANVQTVSEVMITKYSTSSYGVTPGGCIQRFPHGEILCPTSEPLD